MEKANIDWSTLGFSYMKTDKRYISRWKDGKWDDGALVEDNQIRSIKFKYDNTEYIITTKP